MNKLLLIILIITFTHKAISLEINLDSILINSRIENTIEIIKNDSLFNKLMKIKNENISFRICDSVLIKDISQIQIKRFYCNINVRVYQQLLNQSIINFNKYYNSVQPKITINKIFINKNSDFLVSIGICTNNIFEFYIFALTDNSINSKLPVYRITCLFDGDVIINYFSSEYTVSSHSIKVDSLENKKDTNKVNEYIVNYDSIAATLNKNGWEKLNFSEKKDRIIKYQNFMKNSLVQEEIQGKYSFDLLIKDDATAIKIAEIYLYNLYGDSIYFEFPLVAVKLSKEVWQIRGMLPPGYVGGTFMVQLRNYDGKVLCIGHDK